MFTEEYDSGFQRLERFLATNFDENKDDHQKSLDAIKNQNYGEALKILTDLADNKNDRIAQYNLSMLYSTGSGVEKDHKKRMYYLDKSASQGFDEAKSALGIEYIEGEDIEKGMSGVSLLKEAANNGCVNAQYNLGAKLLSIIYATGEEDNLQEAIHWFRTAAEKNDPDALYNLGTLYLNGYGVSQNHTKAFDLFEKASKQKWGEYAQLKIALMYMRGMGVPKNEEKALQIFRSGAEKSYPEAFMSLGAHYYDANNFDKAIEYFEKAQKAGWPNATEAIIEVKNKQRGSFNSGGNSNSGGGCFIATAVYDSAESPEVLLLRQFRDEYLKKHSLGRAFIKNYYIYSPSIASYIKKRAYLKVLVKYILISPIVRIVKKII